MCFLAMCIWFCSGQMVFRVLEKPGNTMFTRAFSRNKEISCYFPVCGSILTSVGIFEIM